MVASSKSAHEEANEMLSKTRTTIISLAAAFSFTGAAIIPTAAQARTKKPGKQANQCESLRGLYESDVYQEQYDKAHHASKAQVEKDETHVTEDLDKGEAGGCDISIWREPPPSNGPTTRPAPEGEPKAAGEPASPPPARGTSPPSPTGSHA
jgi:hypothetical protein